MKKFASKPMIIMLICVGLLFGGIFGWQLFKASMVEKYMSNMKAPAVTVSAIEAKYQDWQPKAKAAGTLRAIHGVDVTTEIAGIVSALHFKPGATVKTNDLLIELNADTEIAQQKALQASADLAAIVYKRDKAQYAIRAVSKAVLDADAADLKNKKALAEQQTTIVDQKSIRAPFAGRLGVAIVNIGQYVNPGDKMVTLQALDPIYVDFFMPQQALTYLAVNQPVSLTSDAYPSRTFKGIITTIDPKVDPTTRNVQVEATIPNSKGELLPGMFGSTEVATGKAARYLTVPQTAVTFNPYGEVVFIIKESGKNADGKPKLTVTQTFVETGLKRGDQVAILSGLKEGDKVVSGGQIKLKNGSEVVINNQIVPANEANPNVENS